MFGFSSLTNSWELQSWFAAVLFKNWCCAALVVQQLYSTTTTATSIKRQINPFGKNRREKRSWFFYQVAFTLAKGHHDNASLALRQSPPFQTNS